MSMVWTIVIDNMDTTVDNHYAEKAPSQIWDWLELFNLIYHFIVTCNACRNWDSYALRYVIRYEVGDL